MRYRSHIVRRTSDLEPETSDVVRRAIRRITPGARAAVLAAVDIGASLAPDAALIVVAPVTVLSASMMTGARDLTAACAAGAGATFRSDPALILEVMDNMTLAALTIAIAFRGDAINLGSGAGQTIAALEIAAERIERGAPEALVVTATEPGNGPGAACVVRFTGGGGGIGVRIVGVEVSDAVPPPQPLAAWVSEVDHLPPGRHVTRLFDVGYAATIEVDL